MPSYLKEQRQINPTVEVDEKMACKAQDIITSFISDDYLEYIFDEKSAHVMRVVKDTFRQANLKQIKLN